MNKYYLVYRRANGNIAGYIKRWMKLEFARKENNFGSLYLDLEPIYPVNFFEIDGQLEVYHSIGGGQAFLEGGVSWFIRLVRDKYDEQGNKFIHILAYDSVHLLERRIIAYPAGNAYTEKTAPADDMIKAIVRENLGSLCVDSTRDLSKYLRIDPDTSQCPSVSRSFSWRKLLPTIQDIANDSLNAGTYLSFDVVRTGPSQFTFKTYPYYRGTNRGLTSKNQLIVSIERGNLSYSTITFDHSDTYNFIYAGGQGREVDRVVKTAQDDSTVNLSPFNRVEDFINTARLDTDASVLAEANTRLKEKAPKILVNGHIVQTENLIYGLHYGFGDIIVMKHGKYSFDVHLSTISTVVDRNGKADIRLYARNYEESLE